MVEELWMLMRKAFMRKKNKQKMVNSKNEYLTEKIHICRVSGQQQHKIRRPGELEEVVGQHQHI